MTLHNRSELLDPIYDLNETIDYLSCLEGKKAKIARFAISSMIGIGTGLAMMPIFDAEIENFDKIGITIEDSSLGSAIETLNTLFIFSSIASVTLYFFLKEERQAHDSCIKKAVMNVGKVASLCSTILPLAQLWYVELENQRYSNEEGFNQFIAWAALTSVPLCVFRAVEAYEYMHNLVGNSVQNISLESLGSKLFLYVPTFLSFFGRFITYSASATYLAEEIGIYKELSIILGTIIGGVMGSTVIGVSEYQAMKELFTRHEGSYSYKQITGGALSTLEGVILTLPLITTGLIATEGWNPFIKGLLLSPLLVSHTILESRNIYKAFSKLSSSIKGQGTQQESQDDLLIINDGSSTTEESLSGDVFEGYEAI